MSPIKHYSFDLWFTLIRSNPVFKQERVRYFHRHYNEYRLTHEEISGIFRKVDLLCNAINEKTGTSIPAEAMYLMAIYELQKGATDFEPLDMSVILADMERLFFEYPPVVYCSNTQKVLGELRERPNCTMGILSNTGFIKGSSLRKALGVLGLANYFDFQMYSDEQGISKPNPLFFDGMVAAAAASHGGQVDKHEIIHIGDNPNADAGGAAAIGIRSLLVNSNNTCISAILH